MKKSRGILTIDPEQRGHKTNFFATLLSDTTHPSDLFEMSHDVREEIDEFLERGPTQVRGSTVRPLIPPTGVLHSLQAHWAVPTLIAISIFVVAVHFNALGCSIGVSEKAYAELQAQLRKDYFPGQPSYPYSKTVIGPVALRLQIPLHLPMHKKCT